MHRIAKTCKTIYHNMIILPAFTSLPNLSISASATLITLRTKLGHLVPMILLSAHTSHFRSQTDGFLRFGTLKRMRKESVYSSALLDQRWTRNPTSACHLTPHSSPHLIISATRPPLSSISCPLPLDFKSIITLSIHHDFRRAERQDHTKGTLTSKGPTSIELRASSSKKRVTTHK